MKKIIGVLLVLVMVMGSVQVGLVDVEGYEAEVIKVYYDNDQVYFDVDPMLINNRTMVPVRAIFEAMGMTVEWDGETKTVTGIGDGLLVELVIDDVEARVNGKVVELDQAATVVNNRTLVPVRFIAESTGALVEWNGEKRYVEIWSEERILAEELGIRPMYVAEVTENINSLDYVIRSGYGTVESRGEGYKILALGEIESGNIYNNQYDRTAEIYDMLIPDTQIDYKVSTVGIDYSEYDVVVVYDFELVRGLESVMEENEDTYFVISGTRDDTLMGDVDVINRLGELVNVVVAGVVEFPKLVNYMEDEIFTEIKVDVYVPVYYSDKSDDAALSSVACSVVLVDDVIGANDIAGYINIHSKMRDVDFMYEGMVLPMLDYKILFGKSGGYDFFSESMNLDPQYKGDGAQVVMLDSVYNPNTPELAGYINQVTYFPIGASYMLSDSELAHASVMSKVVHSLAPEAEVDVLLQDVYWTEDLSVNTANMKAALKWVLAHADEIDVISMSWGATYVNDSDLLELVEEVADAGVIVSWPRVPFSHENVMRVQSVAEICNKDTENEFLSADLWPDGYETYAYNRFYEDYDFNDATMWGVSQLSPTGAGLVAVLRGVDDDISGSEIQDWFERVYIPCDEDGSVGVPDMGRISRFVADGMEYVKGVSIDLDSVEIVADSDYSFMIEGRHYEGGKSYEVPLDDRFGNLLKVAVEGDGESVIEGTQVIDLIALKDVSGQLVIDSTFNGTVEIDGVSLEVAVGYNYVDGLVSDDGELVVSDVVVEYLVSK